MLIDPSLAEFPGDVVIRAFVGWGREDPFRRVHLHELTVEEKGRPIATRAACFVLLVTRMIVYSARSFLSVSSIFMVEMGSSRKWVHQA